MYSNLQDWQIELSNYFKKQKGQNYPCSNQVVICGFCTFNFQKWEEFRDNQKNYIYKQQFSIRLKNGERWAFINPYSNSIRGYRFYKVLADKTLDKKIINNYIVALCAHYCKSFEWF